MHSITPESTHAESVTSNLKQITLSYEELVVCQQRQNTVLNPDVDPVSLGNPHFSVEEFEKLARYCSGHRKHSNVSVIVTKSRAVQEGAERAS